MHKAIPLDERMMPYLLQSGFAGLSKLRSIQLDWALLTALVERWRPETHTFHLPHGEMTITLQDIEVLFGLPVDGRPVIGSTNQPWPALANDLLGESPPEEMYRGGRLSMTWLSKKFCLLLDRVPEEDVRRHTRAYILQICGGILFADKSGNLVHLMFLQLLRNFPEAGQYSWGSASLAWLYRQLCRTALCQTKELGGAALLLQVWAWCRFPHIAPVPKWGNALQDYEPAACQWDIDRNTIQHPTHVVRAYREAFDRQTPHQVCNSINDIFLGPSSYLH